MQGPNVKKLIVRKMSTDAIPPGGGLAAGIKFLSSKENIVAGAKAATQWVEAAIAAVKSAPDNPFGNDDEAIAAEILHRLEKQDRAGTEKRNP